MEFTQLSSKDFVEALASKKPVPGGGGASALVGAIGIALGAMVANLTIGKEKYADVQDEIIALKEKTEALQEQFLQLVEDDASVFEPLARAYSLPTGTDEQRAHKADVMEECLLAASDVPMQIMAKCCEAIDLHEKYQQIGAKIAISDVGVGVIFCQAALRGASLNVFINTKAMAQRDKAEALNTKATEMLDLYTQKAEAIFSDVLKMLK